MATYAAVDGSRLAGALADIPAVRDRLGGAPSSWRIREVGDGNLNLVFIVESDRDGVVVKQALPYVRLVGESWPLPLERSWFEYRALTEQAQHAPGLTPKLFHFDRAQAMIVMEYLRPHVIMRKGLIRASNIPTSPATSPSSWPRRCSTRPPSPEARRRTRRGSNCSRRTRRCAKSPRISFSPTPIARRRSTVGRGPILTPTSRRSSATAR